MTDEKLVFLLDVDNTVLDNDAVKRDLDHQVRTFAGHQQAERFWNLYEEVRQELDIIDIPETLKQWRELTPLSDVNEMTYLHVLSIFDKYPFSNALYPHAIETLEYLGMLGTTVIVSDGDFYFQAKKILDSNLAKVVDYRVLLYVHKQEHIDEIVKVYPAQHYVIVDDKPQIGLDFKAILGEKITTVFVKQGKYAHRPLPTGFDPDIIVDAFSDLRRYSIEQFRAAKTYMGT